MLGNLKKYILDVPSKITDEERFVEALLKYSRNEKLVRNFVSACHEHPWEIEERKDEILWNGIYLDDIYSDCFYGYNDLNLVEEFMTSSTTVSITLLMLLYCFFDKEELSICYLEYDTCGIVDYILNKNYSGFKENFKFTDLFIDYRTFFEENFPLEDGYLTQSYCDKNDLGDVDYDSFQCETIGCVFAICLNNSDKLTKFKEVMNVIGFNSFSDDVYCKDVFDYDGFPDELITIDYSEELINLLNQENQVRDVSEYHSVFRVFKSFEYNLIDNVIGEISRSNISSREVIL